MYRKQVGTDAHLVAWLEVRLFPGGLVEILPSIENGYLLVTGPTSIGSPMYDVGMAAGDRITKVGDRTITTAPELRQAIEARRPGEPVRVTWVGRGGEKSAMMTLREDPDVEVVAFEAAGRTPTAAQLAFRASWVGSRIRQ